MVAVLFFALSSCFELLCVILYAYVFPKLAIVKHYRSKTASEGSKTVSADLAAAGIQTSPGEVHILFLDIPICCVEIQFARLMSFFFSGRGRFKTAWTQRTKTIVYGKHRLCTWFVPNLCANTVYFPWLLIRRYRITQFRHLVRS